MPPLLAPQKPLESSIADWSQIHTELIWASEHEVPPRFLDCNYFSENRVVAWLIRRGMVQVNIEGQTTSAHEGQWIFPGTRDGWVNFLPGSVILSIRFCAEWETGKTLFDHHTPIVLQAGAERKLTQAAKNLQTVVRRFSSKENLFSFNQTMTTVNRHFTIQHAFYNWLCAYINTMLDCGQDPSSMALVDLRVLQAVRLIDNNAPRFSLSEAELARLVGLGVRQLNRLFLSEIGLSPKQYIDRKRLKEAVSLLQYHRRSVKEVAYRLGFRSVSNFSVWFARLKAIRPQAFQKQQYH